jgi:hypothetical protein
VGVADLVAHECRARVPLLEVGFLQFFKAFVDQPPVSEYAAVCSLLRDKWEWLLRTSCVNKDGVMDVTSLFLGSLHASGLATAAADVAARGLRGCALPGCGKRELHVSQFKKCASCCQVVYCGRDCQEKDWARHKAACKQAHAAQRTASDDEAGPADARGA